MKLVLFLTFSCLVINILAFPKHSSNCAECEDIQKAKFFIAYLRKMGTEKTKVFFKDIAEENSPNMLEVVENIIEYEDDEFDEYIQNLPEDLQDFAYESKYNSKLNSDDFKRLLKAYKRYVQKILIDINEFLKDEDKPGLQEELDEYKNSLNETEKIIAEVIIQLQKSSDLSKMLKITT